jgi:transcriptional regulator with XRE-family HTH domain
MGESLPGASGVAQARWFRVLAGPPFAAEVADILGFVGERHELAGFLRSRRERVTPESVGIRGLGRRRVAGLRREEVAQLAGISAEYYQRLEQGRAAHPSPEVLDALGAALRLDDVERAHLRTLAGPVRERRRAATPADVARADPRARHGDQRPVRRPGGQRRGRAPVQV